MEAIRLSPFVIEYEHKSYSPIRYLTRVYWDDIAHAILKVICFCVTTGAIIIVTATGVVDGRSKPLMESIVQRRRRRAIEQGSTVYLLGTGVFSNGIDTYSVIDTVSNER